MRIQTDFYMQYFILQLSLWSEISGLVLKFEVLGFLVSQSDAVLFSFLREMLMINKPLR